MSKRWQQLATYAGWGLALAFFVASLRHLSTSTDWQALLMRTNRYDLLLATGILFMGLGIRALAGYVDSVVIGFPLTIRESYRYWFLSQLSKYVPGSVWQFATRSVFYQRHGLSPVMASMLTVWEALLLLVVGLGFIALAPGLLFQTDTTLSLIIGVAGVLVLLILLLVPLPWRILQAVPVVRRIADKMLQAIEELGQRRFLLCGALFVLSLIGWMFINTSFYVLVRALPGTENLDYITLIVIFSIGWTAGFLVFFTPGGIGSREAVLTVLLTPLLSLELATTAALLARLCWTLTEGVHIGIALTWHLMLPAFQDHQTEDKPL